jgi:hypothetical protein
MSRCSKCGLHWRTLPGEENDHGCPRCEPWPEERVDARCCGLCGDADGDLQNCAECGELVCVDCRNQSLCVLCRHEAAGGEG